MPDQSGARSANSFQASSAFSYAGQLAPSASAISTTMRKSSRAFPGHGTARRTRFTRRSVFVNVPSFSAKLEAGKITSAYLRFESLRKRSCATTKSSFSMPSSTWCAFGSVCTGFSPIR